MYDSTYINIFSFDTIVNVNYHKYNVIRAVTNFNCNYVCTEVHKVKVCKRNNSNLYY